MERLQKLALSLSLARELVAFIDFLIPTEWISVAILLPSGGLQDS